MTDTSEHEAIPVERSRRLRPNSVAHYCLYAASRSAHEDLTERPD